MAYPIPRIARVFSLILRPATFCLIAAFPSLLVDEELSLLSESSSELLPSLSLLEPSCFDDLLVFDSSISYDASLSLGFFI